MISLGKYLSFFFQKHHEILLNNYPGLKIERLESEIQVYLKYQFGSGHHCLQHIFSENSQDEKSLIIQTFFNKILEGIPLEYISGKSFFYNMELSVNKNVLIPRSETEIMVERVLEEIKTFKKNGFSQVDVLDLGTGSGAIILTLLQESCLKLKCFASDISLDALEIAKRNYYNLGYLLPENSSLKFIESDLFSNIDSKFDMIITNPPYIKFKKDKSQVHTQVDKFEPHVALYLDDESYDEWFRRLFSGAYQLLNEGGYFIMEGHEDHLENLSISLSRLKFRNIKILKDYTGRDRFVEAYR